jgi:hypothetical protein
LPLGLLQLINELCGEGEKYFFDLFYFNICALRIKQQQQQRQAGKKLRNQPLKNLNNKKKPFIMV